MARTGRFGRLPTAAPDLSSQIASMIEQYQNARDKNIYNAWSTPGGRFEGKKVTDADLLAYYKSRRDDYEKGDPEYDEWDSRVHQIAFEISDQRVGMLYANGRIKAGDVANHYRRWARQMPKNSAVYRDLMSRAGQFTRNQRAARKAKASDGNWKRFQNRWNSIEDEYVKPAVDVIEVITNAARAGGYIGNDQDLWAMNSQEVGTLDDLLVAIQDSDLPDKEDKNKSLYDVLSRDMARAVPGWKPSDGIDMPLLTRLTNRADRGMDMQIDLAKGYKGGDLSSWVQNRFNTKGEMRRYRRLQKRVDIVGEYMEANQAWRDRRAKGKGDPFVMGSADPEYREALVHAKKRALRMRDFGMVGQLDAEIKMIDGDFTSLIGTDVTFLWQDSMTVGEGGATSAMQPGFVESAARNSYNLKMAQRGLIDGTHYVEPYEGGDPMEQTGLVGSDPGYSIKPFPVDADGFVGFKEDKYFPISRVHENPDGSMVPYTLVAVGEPFYADLNEGSTEADADHTPVLIGYVVTYDGSVQMTKVIDPDTGDIRLVDGNAFDRPGSVVMKNDRGDGFLLVKDDILDTPLPDWRKVIDEGFVNTPGEALETAENPLGPNVPLTPSESEDASGEVFRGLTDEAGDYLDFALNDSQRKALWDAGLIEYRPAEPGYQYNTRFKDGASMQQVADVLEGTGDRTAIEDIRALQPSTLPGAGGAKEPPPAAVGGAAPEVPVTPAEPERAAMTPMRPEQPDPTKFPPGSPEHDQWLKDTDAWAQGINDARKRQGLPPLDIWIHPDPGPQPESDDPMVQLKWRQEKELHEASVEHRRPEAVTIFHEGKLLRAEPGQPVDTRTKITPRQETTFDPETGKITRYNVPRERGGLPPGWEPTTPEPTQGIIEGIMGMLSGGVGNAVFDVQHQEWVEEQWRLAEAAGQTPEQLEAAAGGRARGVPGPVINPVTGEPFDRAAGGVNPPPSDWDRIVQGIGETFTAGDEAMRNFNGLGPYPGERRPENEDDDDLLVLDDEGRTDLSSPVFRTWALAQLESKGPMSFRSSTLLSMARDRNTRRAMMDPKYMATWIRQMMTEGQISRDELHLAVEEIDNYMQWRDSRTELEMALKAGADGTWQTDPFNVLQWSERKAEDRGPMIRTLEKDYPGLLRELDPDAEIIDRDPNSPNFGKVMNIKGSIGRGPYNPAGSDAIPAPVKGAPRIPFATTDPLTGTRDVPGSIVNDVAPPETAPLVGATPKSLKVPEFAGFGIIGSPLASAFKPPSVNRPPPSLPFGAGSGPSGGPPNRPPAPLALPTFSLGTPTKPVTPSGRPPQAV